MTIAEIIHRIAADKELQTMLVVVALDLVLGVLAAFRLGTFQLAYVSNFMRNDVLGKVVPWAVVDAFAVVAGGLGIVIPQVDLSSIAKAAGGLIIAAMVGSILKSIGDLFPAMSIPNVIGGSGRNIPPAP